MRSAIRAASQLPGRGPTDVHVNQKSNDDDDEWVVKVGRWGGGGGQGGYGRWGEGVNEGLTSILEQPNSEIVHVTLTRQYACSIIMSAKNVTV